ncbi:MAG: SipW-dependent-type signal peptide-containing protein [Bacillota bacterium]
MLRKKIYLVLVLVVLAAFAAGGATYALFTDAASNQSNTFTAGTVEIGADRDLGDPIPGPMFYTTRDEGNFAGHPGWPDHATGFWCPGMSATRQLIVYNTGTLNVQLKGVSAALSGIDDPATAQEWAENMKVKIYVSNGGEVLYDGTMAALLAGEAPFDHAVFIGAQPGVMPPPNVHLSFEVTMDLAAGNNLQGLTPVLSFSVHAQQAG